MAVSSLQGALTQEEEERLLRAFSEAAANGEYGNITPHRLCKDAGDKILLAAWKVAAKHKQILSMVKYMQGKSSSNAVLGQQHYEKLCRQYGLTPHGLSTTTTSTTTTTTTTATTATVARGTPLARVLPPLAPRRAASTDPAATTSGTATIHPTVAAPHGLAMTTTTKTVAAAPGTSHRPPLAHHSAASINQTPASDRAASVHWDDQADPQTLQPVQSPWPYREPAGPDLSTPRQLYSGQKNWKETSLAAVSAIKDRQMSNLHAIANENHMASELHRDAVEKYVSTVHAKKDKLVALWEAKHEEDSEELRAEKAVLAAYNVLELERLQLENALLKQRLEAGNHPCSTADDAALPMGNWPAADDDRKPPARKLAPGLFPPVPSVNNPFSDPPMDEANQTAIPATTAAATTPAMILKVANPPSSAILNMLNDWPATDEDCKPPARKLAPGLFPPVPNVNNPAADPPATFRKMPSVEGSGTTLTNMACNNPFGIMMWQPAPRVPAIIPFSSTLETYLADERRRALSACPARDNNATPSHSKNKRPGDDLTKGGEIQGGKKPYNG